MMTRCMEVVMPDGTEVSVAMAPAYLEFPQGTVQVTKGHDVTYLVPMSQVRGKRTEYDIHRIDPEGQLGYQGHDHDFTESVRKARVA